jgi:hypothetical protein
MGVSFAKRWGIVSLDFKKARANWLKKAEYPSFRLFGA